MRETTCGTFTLGFFFFAGSSQKCLCGSFTKSVVISLVDNWTIQIFASSSGAPSRFRMWASSLNTAPKEACRMSSSMMKSQSTGALGEEMSHIRSPHNRKIACSFVKQCNWSLHVVGDEVHQHNLMRSNKRA